jgi:formylglycine-generating enzyme required for sulfatase activity
MILVLCSAGIAQAHSGYPVPVGQSFRDCPQCPELVVIRAGRFIMGSPASERGRRTDEGPQREVTVSAPLAVGRFEVTSAEWDACAAAGGCPRYRPDSEHGTRGRMPMINVAWTDAQQYVRWLSQLTDRRYRLLTEAEWEYAARAGTTTAFSTGLSIAQTHANFRRGRGSRLRPVGDLLPSDWGLHDMHGNVQEWVQDCYLGSYASAPTDAAVAAATFGRDCPRVVRGGMWNEPAAATRSARRNHLDQNLREASIGFRIARMPD